MSEFVVSVCTDFILFTFLSINIFFFPFRQFFSTVLPLYIFLLSINIISPLPDIDKGLQVFLSTEQENQVNAVAGLNRPSRDDFRFQRQNTSNVHSFEHAYVGRMRRSAGCFIERTTELCGKDLIITVKCRKRSVSCNNGGVAPRCVTEKTYFAACGKVLATDCSCAKP